MLPPDQLVVAKAPQKGKASCMQVGRLESSKFAAVTLQTHSFWDDRSVRLLPSRVLAPRSDPNFETVENFARQHRTKLTVVSSSSDLGYDGVTVCLSRKARGVAGED